MMMKNTIHGLVAVIAASTMSVALAQTPKDVALETLAAIFTHYDADAVNRLLREDYIQHNPAVPTGRAPILALLPALKDSGISVTTHRLIAEDDLVVAHNSYDNAQAFGNEHIVAFDVFRIEDGKVAEHWDNLAPKTAPNPSGHTQVDGPTEIVDTDKTAENKALVSDFVNAILVNGDMARLGEFIEDANYTQHNSQIGDGLSGLDTALKALAAQGILMKYHTVHKVIAEGNFVFTMSEGTFGDAPTAFFDLFRVDQGKIVEHWDIIPEIPAEMAHNNGKFVPKPVVEVVTLKLKEGVSVADFASLDKAVEDQHVSQQPGFISRESAAGENGEWLVIVHWETARDADASMSTFMDAAAAKTFMESIDASTMVMKRYSAVR